MFHVGSVLYEELSGGMYDRSQLPDICLVDGNYPGEAVLRQIFAEIQRIPLYQWREFTAGGVVPIAVAIANGRYPAYKSSVSAIITLAAAVGFMLFPSLVGVVAEADFWRGIGLLNIFPVCIAACMLMAGRAARNYKNENERSNRL